VTEKEEMEGGLSYMIEREKVAEGISYMIEGAEVAQEFAFVIEGENRITLGRPSSLLKGVRFEDLNEGFYKIHYFLGLEIQIL